MTSTPLVKVQDLRVAFKDSNSLNEVVKGVSFTLDKGETLALVGESGSGKSVTALSLVKLLPYPLASHPGGHIYVEGKDVLTFSKRQIQQLRKQKISFIFQEPLSSLNPLHTIERQLSESLCLFEATRGRHLQKTALKERCHDLLKLVGFSDFDNRLGSYPHELSGGQRQRVMIAMALASEPDLLIADEPTTALDVTTQAQIISLLTDLQKRLGMAMLLISHDLGLVQKIAQRAAIMKDGLLVEQGPVSTIFTHPQHAYTKRLLAAEPEGRAAPLSNIVSASSGSSKLSPFSQSEKRLSDQRGAPLVKSLFEARDLDVAFPVKKGIFQRTVGFVNAVQKASFTLQKGETLGIVGESGSGKTTLAMALLQLQNSSGSIWFGGDPIQGLKGKKLKALRRHLQIVFQDPFGALSPRMTVHQIVEEGLDVHGLHTRPEEREEEVLEILKKVGLDPASRHRYPHEFSGGQRQRIAIARALILKPSILILDEPTSALDRVIQKEVLSLLKKLQQEEQISYIFISHDLKVIRSISHHILVMKDGQVVEEGPTDSLFERPQHPYTQSLLKAAFHFETL